MSKIASKLGKKYEENRLAVLTRSFELGGYTFRVKIPSVSQIETIYANFKNPDKERLEVIYQDLIKDVKEIKGEGIEIKDDDVLIEGRSMREAAKNKLAVEYRTTEYFKFLLGENNETLEDITYADIEAEFPLSIQLSIVEKINQVISPDYKDIKEK